MGTAGPESEEITLTPGMLVSPSDLPDDQLVARCLEEDGRAWEVLVRRYRRLVWSIALSRGLQEDDAAEAFQRTWVTVHRSLRSLRSIDRLTSWIAAVARSQASRVLRSKSLDRRVARELEERARAAGEGTEEAEDFQHVSAALDRLTAKCRDLLRRLYWEEDSYDSVVRATGMAPGSVGPTRARCLAKMREILESMEGDAR